MTRPSQGGHQCRIATERAAVGAGSLNDKAEASSVARGYFRGGRVGEPLLWHDLALGPNGLAHLTDPSLLDNFGASGQQAFWRTSENMVSRAVHVAAPCTLGRAAICRAGAVSASPVLIAESSIPHHHVREHMPQPPKGAWCVWHGQHGGKRTAMATAKRAVGQGAGAAGRGTRIRPAALPRPTLAQMPGAPRASRGQGRLAGHQACRLATRRRPVPRSRTAEGHGPCLAEMSSNCGGLGATSAGTGWKLFLLAPLRILPNSAAFAFIFGFLLSPVRIHVRQHELESYKNMGMGVCPCVGSVSTIHSIKVLHTPPHFHRWKITGYKTAESDMPLLKQEAGSTMWP